MSNLGDAAADLMLDVCDLRVSFPGDDGPVTVVQGFGLAVKRRQRFGIVGESGSGKSVAMLAVQGLIDPPGIVTAASIDLNGHRLDPADPDGFRAVRGRDVALVMQDPLVSLSPVFPIGDQIAETLRHRHGTGARAARTEAVDLLAAVGIPDPAERARDYPHRLSGGMRQRVAIALALACRPALLVADEPTTALDPTIRAQVMELLVRVAEDHAMAVVLITHDFGVLAGFAEAMAVMYAGGVVERGAVEDIFRRPAHPYTVALLASQPRLDGPHQSRLPAIAGQPPDPARRPTGCPFHPRCAVGRDRFRCAAEPPVLRQVGAPGQWAACHFAEEVLAMADERAVGSSGIADGAMR